ncbi:MAG: 2-oxoglutarate dehydrogenase E1 component, partial [Acidobacteriota bacterium]
AETLNLSQLEGYQTGGTIHIVINNQIGFTTLPEDARSTRYSTDIAKMLMVPIFHVHGEDPEAAAHAIRLACDYRMEFGKDAVIDLVCYRRFGHNEGDEPYYTQPKMYDRIKDRPAAYEIYAEKLREEGIVTQEDVDRIKDGVNQCLGMAYRMAREHECVEPEPKFYDMWEGLDSRYSHEPVETGVAEETLVSFARRLHAYPEGFGVHRKLERILSRRVDVVEKGEGIDWATAEALAFGSLLIEGNPIRLTGQDSRRGTFSQRHSVLSDPESGEHYTPLNHLAEGQALYHVYDSMLSENAVLGFEYGFSLVTPHWLVIWEAQFGDFVNNAQVVVDQFIVSAETKWHRKSGLVLLLPHALEGQGAEHSSARLERFLQMCAEDNMQVCFPTTPAQYFHLLRRQVRRNFRKPLIVMSPKSLLRHPLAVSNLSELSKGRFFEVLGEIDPVENPSRVLLCSGKVYYDLLEKRRSLQGAADTAIVRIEQLYPFPKAQLEETLSKYPGVKDWVWVQEEPRNMGAWTFVRRRLEEILGKTVEYIGRPEAATPSVGHMSTYRTHQAALMNRVFGE